MILVTSYIELLKLKHRVSYLSQNLRAHFLLRFFLRVIFYRK